MPSKSAKQAKLMRAVAHNPKFARKVGIPQSVGRDFAEADKRTGRYARGGSVLGALARPAMRSMRPVPDVRDPSDMLRSADAAISSGYARLRAIRKAKGGKIKTAMKLIQGGGKPPPDRSAEIVKNVKDKLAAARAGEKVDPISMKNSLAEYAKSWREGIARSKAARTRKAVVPQDTARIQLEVAKPVAEFPGEFDDIHDDSLSPKDLRIGLEDWLEEAGLDRKLAKNFDIYQKPVFIETDSGNPTHASAYWDVGFEGPQDIVDALNKYLESEN